MSPQRPIRRGAALIVALMVASCSPSSPPREPVADQPVAAAAAPEEATVMPTDARDSNANIPLCCGSWDEIKRLDGQRVRLRGTYERTVVSKRAAKLGLAEPQPDLDRPGTAAIQTTGANVMLEIYYQPAGSRSVAESKQFHGRRVEVIGVLHEATPTQHHDGIPMQTMINPYIGAIEDIRLVPED